MKKFICTLFFILVTPLLYFTLFHHQHYQHIPTNADSGFDSDYSDYDDGYWDDDNDSSWAGGGSDDNYSGSSFSSSIGPVDSGTLILTLIIIAVPIVILIPLKPGITNLNKKRKKKIATKNHINTILSHNFNLQPGDGYNNDLIQSAYNSYVEIQKAWMNRDISKVRHLLTDEIYNMYQMQVETLLEDNQINVMSDFEFVCGGINYISTNKNTETIKIILCVNCKDYIKESNTNKVINGDKRSTITYIYELTFVRDIKSNKTSNCPTCGAKVKNQMSTTCPYCNNSLLLTSSNLTLSNKLILHQFKQR